MLSSYYQFELIIDFQIMMSNHITKQLFMTLYFILLSNEFSASSWRTDGHDRDTPKTNESEAATPSSSKCSNISTSILCILNNCIWCEEKCRLKSDCPEDHFRDNSEINCTQIMAVPNTLSVRSLPVAVKVYQMSHSVNCFSQQPSNCYLVINSTVIVTSAMVIQNGVLCNLDVRIAKRASNLNQTETNLDLYLEDPRVTSKGTSTATIILYHCSAMLSCKDCLSSVHQCQWCWGGEGCSDIGRTCSGVDGSIIPQISPKQSRDIIVTYNKSTAISIDVTIPKKSADCLFNVSLSCQFHQGDEVRKVTGKLEFDEESSSNISQPWYETQVVCDPISFAPVDTHLKISLSVKSISSQEIFRNKSDLHILIDTCSTSDLTRTCKGCTSHSPFNSRGPIGCVWCEGSSCTHPQQCTSTASSIETSTHCPVVDLTPSVATVVGVASGLFVSLCFLFAVTVARRKMDKGKIQQVPMESVCNRSERPRTCPSSHKQECSPADVEHWLKYHCSSEASASIEDDMLSIPWSDETGSQVQLTKMNWKGGEGTSRPNQDGSVADSVRGEPEELKRPSFVVRGFRAMRY